MRPRLYLLIEGPLDSKFFSRSLSLLLRKKFRKIWYFPYAKEPKKEIEGFIKTGNTCGRIIFVHDFDKGPCFSHWKTTLAARYQALSEDSIIIPKREIESWLLAGISDTVASTLKIDTEQLSTDNIGKKGFDRFKPESISPKEFENTLIRCFNVDNAKSRNQSFKYFIDEFL